MCRRAVSWSPLAREEKLTGSDVSVAVKTPSEPVATPVASSGVSRLGWYTVYMTGLVAIMSQIDRGILSLFVQPMKRDFHLSDTEMSILLGFAFTFFYVVGGPPLSRAADGGVRKIVISGCLAVWSLATAFCGIAQNFWSFFVARAVIGGSESGCGPASMAMIADAIPRERLPRAYAIYNAGFLGGGALSLVVGGVLIGALAHIQPIHIAGIGVIHNWQLVFMILGFPGLLIAAWFALTVPEPPRKGGTKPGGYPMREVLKFVVSQRAFHVPLILGSLINGFQIYGLAVWMPAFYQRTYGWGPATIGPLLGIVTLATGTIGLFLGARLTEIFDKRRDDANVLMMLLAAALPIPFAVLGPLMPTPWLALGFLAIAGVFSTMGASGYSTALNMATPNEMRSQIMVMYFIINNAIAGSLGPTLVALCTDFIAHNEADLRYVIVAFRLAFGPLASFFLWKALKPFAKIYRQKIEEGL